MALTTEQATKDFAAALTEAKKQRDTARAIIAACQHKIAHNHFAALEGAIDRANATRARLAAKNGPHLGPQWIAAQTYALAEATEQIVHDVRVIAYTSVTGKLPQEVAHAPRS